MVLIGWYQTYHGDDGHKLLEFCCMYHRGVVSCGINRWHLTYPGDNGNDIFEFCFYESTGVPPEDGRKRKVVHIERSITHSLEI